MKIRILSAAKRDLIRGKQFYEGQENGLGDYFLDSLSSDIESLKVYAGIHRNVHGYHCLFSKRFPYAVYYGKESNVVSIFRVLDCRQDPGKLRSALD